MNRNLKIGLYTLGGLVVATGIFFGVRAIIKSAKKGKISDAELEELRILREKLENGTITDRERELLTELENKDEDAPVVNIGDGEVTAPNTSTFPIKNGDSSDDVARIQLALNENHSGKLVPGWCCTPGNGITNTDLKVDGQLGKKTAEVLGAYEDFCKCSGFMGLVCNCTGLSINKTRYEALIQGVDVSDEALADAGYTVKFPSTSSFSGYSNARGSRMMSRRRVVGDCPPGQVYEDGMCKPIGAPSSRYSNFNLPQYGKKYDSPLGNFYKSKYAFTDDYPKQSNLGHSYGMGKGFGFDGGNYMGFVGKTGSESEIQTVQEFIEDVP